MSNTDIDIFNSITDRNCVDMYIIYMYIICTLMQEFNKKCTLYTCCKILPYIIDLKYYKHHFVNCFGGQKRTNDIVDSSLILIKQYFYLNL